MKNQNEIDRSERFPHKPYINVGFPKNVTAVVDSTVTFSCPIVSDLEPYIQWVRVAEYPDNEEGSPNGTLLQVEKRTRALIRIIGSGGVGSGGGGGGGGDAGGGHCEFRGYILPPLY